MPRDLTSLTALITGSVSGLGLAIAHRLASHGVHISFNDLPHQTPLLITHCSTFATTYNIKTTFIAADISTPSGCSDAVKHTLIALGSVDIIISNAGWTKMAKWDDLEAFSEEDWLLSYKINTLAPMWLLKAAKPHWKSTYSTTGTAGVLITTNSLAGLTCIGSSMPYSVTKTAQLRVVEGLAYNNGPWARANAVCPGLMMTGFVEGLGEERIEELKGGAVLGKAVDLEDCAEVFVMLCRNESMTGKHVTVDCGLGRVS